MPIRIIPPIASARLPTSPPIFLPDRKPTAVAAKAMPPIVELASTILTSRNAKVNPTAKASMLVATDKVKRRMPFVISVDGVFPPLDRNDSQIILPPTSASKMKATQWSYAAIIFTIVCPANHPRASITA